MRINVPQIAKPTVPQIPGQAVLDEENTTVLQGEVPRLPAALEAQQQAVTQPTPPVGGRPSREQMMAAVVARSNEGKNPAFINPTNPEATTAEAARLFVGDTEPTYPATNINEVPQTWMHPQR